MFINHPVKTVARPTVFYPIGLHLEDFLYFWGRVRKLRVDTVYRIDDGPSPTVPTSFGDAMAVLDAMRASAAIGSQIFQGLVSRQTKEGEEGQTVGVPYPRFEGQGLSIDFGRSITFLGLFYPRITYSFGGGVSSYSGGNLLSNISLRGFGLIPIYSTNSNVEEICAGQISIECEFDEVRLEFENENREFLFTSGYGIPEYSVAYINGLKCGFERVSDRSVFITLPENARSGRIRFESESPAFDSFLTSDIVKL